MVKSFSIPNTPNFSIEKACYDEALARQAKGERVVLAFKDVDEAWYANWIENIPIGRDMSAHRHLSKGSHTPYYLIRKSSTLPLMDFLLSGIVPTT